MKRLLTIIILIILPIISQAQTWFEVGLKGGPATTFLVNKDIFDDVSFDHVLTGTYFYGAKVGINFGPHDGIALHGGGTKLNQNFDNKYEIQTFDRRNFNAQVIEFGALYHRTKETGYFEVGPRMSLVRNAFISDDGGTEVDFEDQINTTYFGADLGFGAYVIGNEQLSVMMGLRFSYGFSNLMDRVDPIAPEQAQYSNASAVHVLSAMFCVELNYSLGYLVRSTCGNRNTWISF